jgi:hypothetical protein
MQTIASALPKKSRDAFWTGKIQKFFNDLVLFCAAKLCIIFEYTMPFWKKNQGTTRNNCKSRQYKICYKTSL